jgi:phage shock protein A
MGLMNRMVRIWRADLHGVMDQIEDKGLLFKQYLREMESSLQQKESRCEVLVRRRRRIERALEMRRREMDKLDADIDISVGRAKDDIARMLIRKRRNLEGTCSQWQQELEEVGGECDSLAALVQQQRLQYDQAKAKADAYFCRARLAHDEVDPMTLGHPFQVHPAMEDEVELELLQRKDKLSRGGA